MAASSVKVTASANNNGVYYRVRVKNNYGTVWSSAVKLTVSGVKPAITTQPSSVTVANGKTATFRVIAAGTGLTYQWQYSSNGGKTWNNWSGKTSSSASVTVGSNNNGLLYRVRV